MLYNYLNINFIACVCGIGTENSSAPQQFSKH